MKFKVEDKVTLKKDASDVRTGIPEYVVNSEIGKIFTVERVFKYSKHDWMTLKDMLFTWRPEQFDLVSESQSIHIYSHDNEVIAMLKTGKQTTKTAKAQCNPSDEFKFEIVAKLAFQRLIGEDENTVREVKRPAKIGEWIKVVTASGHSVEVGTIGQATSTWGRGVYINSDVKGSGRLLFERNYVVLENYHPEDKPKTLADYTIKELVTELSRRYE